MRLRRALSAGKQTARCYRQQRLLRRTFDGAVRERRERYGAPAPPDPSLRAAAEALERDGFVILKQAVDPEVLSRVERELEEALARGDHVPIGRGRREPGRPVTLTPEELQRGNGYVESVAHLAFTKDPFVTCPSAAPLVFSAAVRQIAGAIYGAPPALVAGKVMKSFVNDLPRNAFYNFHWDEQATRLIKFFYYLHDVDEQGGPFCYVRGSHKRRLPGHRRRPFWPDAPIEDYYGREAICRVAARKGDIVIADTTGFHRATKPHSAPRSALLIATGVHPFASRPRLRRADLEGRSVAERAMADFADIV